MSSIRVLLAGTTALLMLAGYLASQNYYFKGPEELSAYVAKVDAQPIRMLATVLFIAALIFAFVPDKEKQGE